ncbi:MAG: hypothetical protein IKZ28_04540, partial [Clostridia bacterium]|nr:hypothetical protein [Clostridia bacterium]
MAKIKVEGTEFSFSLLPVGILPSHSWAKVKIAVKNEFIAYEGRGKLILKEDLEEWIFSMFRLLAGAYGKERSVTFERAGFAVDFYPHTNNGKEVSREERRKNDCVMVIRLLMSSKKE